MDDPNDIEPLLRVFLTDRDVPCPQCGYNLRTLTGDTCPECGEKLALGVHLVEPKQAAAIAGLIGLSAGAGLSGLLLIYRLCAMLPREGLSKEIIKFMWTTGIGFVLLGGLVVAWLVKWRSIRGCSRVTRWTLAGLCWIVTFVDLAAFSYLIN